MKLACILAAAALHAACADTNLVTFTNSAGRVYRDVRITGHDATGFFCWATNGSGSKVLFTEAPEFAASRFQFDPARVVAVAGNQGEQARKYQEWYARESARLLAEQNAQQAYLKRRDELYLSCVRIQGTVVQRSDGRVHVLFGRERIVIQNHPRFDALRSDMRVTLFIRPAGTYSYTNMAGDPLTVRQFDASIPAEFAADGRVQGWFAVNHE